VRGDISLHTARVAIRASVRSERQQFGRPVGRAFSGHCSCTAAYGMQSLVAEKTMTATFFGCAGRREVLHVPDIAAAACGQPSSGPPSSMARMIPLNSSHSPRKLPRTKTARLNAPYCRTSRTFCVSASSGASAINAREPIQWPAMDRPSARPTKATPQRPSS
jgi:hypothetical protein